MTTIYAELSAALKLEPKKGEAAAAFAKRLAVKANGMSDTAWQELTQPAQLWANSALEALEKKASIPLPEGLEEPPATETPPAKKEASSKKKEALAKKEAKPSGLGPKGKFARTDKIKVLPEQNPFRAGTKCFSWFANIRSGMTVAEAVEAGTPRHHIRWAHTLGHLQIGG